MRDGLANAFMTCCFISLVPWVQMNYNNFNIFQQV